MLLELEEEVVEEFHSLVLGCLELVVPDCWKLLEFRDCRKLVEFQDCRGLVVLDCWKLLEFRVIRAGEDPLLLVIEAGEDPQVRVALGVLGQLLSHCFRRLDTMVQVGTGRALLGRQQLG